MGNDYATAWDTLAQIIGRAKGDSSGYVTEIEHLTLDQQLKVAQIAAMLSIAQEISDLNPQNTTENRDDGTYNGWGVKID